MKKILFLFAMIFCFCSCVFLVDNSAFADSPYTNTKIELNIEGVSPISINDIAYFDNQLFITEANTNQIFKYSNNTTTSIFQDPDFTPSEICANNDFVTFITTTDNAVYILKNGPNSAQRIYIFKKDNATASFPQIARIGCSATGEIFTIGENFIAKVVGDKLEYFCALNFEGADLSFVNGGFYVNEDATAIYFSIANKVYTLDTATKSISLANFIIPSEVANISEFAVDNFDNLFAFANSSIIKCNSSGNQTLTFNENYTGMALDFVNGKNYVFDTNGVYESTINVQNFTTAYNNQTTPISMNAVVPSTTGAQILETTTATNLYSFRSLFTTIADYQIGKQLILLDNSDSKFYYVYDNNADNEAGYLLGYVLKDECNFSTTSTPEFEKAKVIVEQAKIFTLPTSVKLNSTTFAPSVKTIARGEIVTIVNSPVLQKDSNGTEFLAIKFTQENNEYIGYIDSRTVINLALDVAIDNLTVSNAITRADVTVYSDISLENEIETIKKDTNITVLESKNGVCKIEYLDNDTIKAGYIQQSFVDDGSFTLTQKIGICLMIVSLIMAIIIAICLNRSFKKRRNKSLDSI